MFKKAAQQGRRDFGARSVVQAVREHGKGPRTPLTAFLNILQISPHMLIKALVSSRKHREDQKVKNFLSHQS